LAEVKRAAGAATTSGSCTVSGSTDTDTDTDTDGSNKCSNRHFSFVEIIGLSVR